MAFYFGSNSDADVEDGNGSSSKSKNIETGIPSGDDEVITGTESLDEEIPLAEDDEPKTKKLSKSSSKKKEEETNEEEEEDDLEKEDEDEDTGTKEEDEDDELSSIGVIAVDFLQKGILVGKEGAKYEDDEVGFSKLMEDTIESRILDSVPDEYASILDAIKQGIPASEWVDLVAPNEDLRNADLEDVENQEILVTRVAKSQGLSDEQIEKRIKRFKTLDILKDEAEEALAILIKDDEVKTAKNNKDIQDNRKKLEKEQQDRINQIYKDADALSEVQGVFLNKKAKKELADYITKPVNAQGHTQYMIDRNDPDTILQAAFLVKNAKNNTLQKVAESKASKSLKERLDKKDDRLTSRKGSTVKENINSSRMPTGLPWMSERQVED